MKHSFLFSCIFPLISLLLLPQYKSQEFSLKSEIAIEKDEKIKQNKKNTNVDETLIYLKSGNLNIQNSNLSKEKGSTDFHKSLLGLNSLLYINNQNSKLEIYFSKLKTKGNYSHIIYK